MTTIITAEDGGVPVGYPSINKLIGDIETIQTGIVDSAYMRKEDYDVDYSDIVDEVELIDGGSF